jgi:hypothetical protein
VFAALQAIYPDIKWSKSWFVNIQDKKVPFYHWSSLKNQRDFFDSVAKSLDIRGNFQ